MIVRIWLHAAGGDRLFSSSTSSPVSALSWRLNGWPYLSFPAFVRIPISVFI